MENNIKAVCGFKDVEGKFFESEIEALRSNLIITASKDIKDQIRDIHNNIYSIPDYKTYYKQSKYYPYEDLYALESAIVTILSSDNGIVLLNILSDKIKQYQKDHNIDIIEISEKANIRVDKSLLEKIRDWFNGSKQ